MLAQCEGNGKTGDVVTLAIVPLPVWRAVKAAPQDVHGRAKAYFSAIKTHISASCGGCMLGKAQSKARKAMRLQACYAQLNYRCATAAATVIGKAPDTLPAYGIFDAETWTELLQIAHLVGLRKIRSAMVGDLGMLPVDVAELLIALAGGWQWLGYTHQWFRSDHLRDTHQASTQGPWGAADAAARRGWAVYHVKSGKDVTIDERFELCPAQVGQILGVKGGCGPCPRQCNGRDRNMTYAIDHGSGANMKASPAAAVALERLSIAAA